MPWNIIGIDPQHPEHQWMQAVADRLREFGVPEPKILACMDGAFEAPTHEFSGEWWSHPDVEFLDLPKFVAVDFFGLKRSIVAVTCVRKPTPNRRTTSWADDSGADFPCVDLNNSDSTGMLHALAEYIKAKLPERM